MVGTRPKKVRPALALGRSFQQARQASGLSLAAAASQLKIPISQLTALEAGDFSVFSAEVYARGACMKYAQFLHLDIVRVEPAISRELSGARQLIPLRLPLPFSWAQRLLTPRLLLMLVGAGVATLVGAYILWQVQTFFAPPRLSLQEPAGSLMVENHVNVRGQAFDASQVTINGEAVLLKDQGMFELPLDLHRGINTIQAEATNVAGRKIVIERTILVTEP